jgi:hypothetical protein
MLSIVSPATNDAVCDRSSRTSCCIRKPKDVDLGGISRISGTKCSSIDVEIKATERLVLLDVATNIWNVLMQKDVFTMTPIIVRVAHIDRIWSLAKSFTEGTEMLILVLNDSL